MTTDLINRYDHRAPHQTSYPTAPHFSAEVTAGDYQKWLATLNTGIPISLYLHVPYCREMHWYYGCNTRATTRHRPIAEYHQSLLAKIDLVAGGLPDRMTANHIHLIVDRPTC